MFFELEKGWNMMIYMANQNILKAKIYSIILMLFVLILYYLRPVIQIPCEPGKSKTI